MLTSMVRLVSTASSLARTRFAAKRSASWVRVRRESGAVRRIAPAAIPTIARTTTISTRVNPESGLALPVADVGIIAFSAFAAVGAQRVQVIGAAASRIDVVIGVTPRIERKAADIAAAAVALGPVEPRRLADKRL